MSRPHSVWYDVCGRNDQETLKKCTWLLKNLADELSLLRDGQIESREEKIDTINDVSFHLEQVLQALDVIDYNLKHEEVNK